MSAKFWNRTAIAAGVILTVIALLPEFPAYFPAWALGTLRGDILFGGGVLIAAGVLLVSAWRYENIRDDEREKERKDQGKKHDDAMVKADENHIAAMSNAEVKHNAAMAKADEQIAAWREMVEITKRTEAFAQSTQSAVLSAVSAGYGAGYNVARAVADDNIASVPTILAEYRSKMIAPFAYGQDPVPPQVRQLENFVDAQIASPPTDYASALALSRQISSLTGSISIPQPQMKGQGTVTESAAKLFPPSESSSGGHRP